jgi:hypothetical protein
MSHKLNTAGLQPEKGSTRNPNRHRNQRRRHPGEKPLDPYKDCDHHKSDG